MAVQSGSPNTKQYRQRLAEILNTIVDCNVVRAPLTGVSNAPFWVIGRPSITFGKVTMQEHYWRYSLRFFLGREFQGNNNTIGLADNIDDDIDNVARYFQDRAKFVSSSFGQDQPGYIPSSLTLTVNGTDSYPLSINASILGSSYDLAWAHRVIYTPPYN